MLDIGASLVRLAALMHVAILLARVLEEAAVTPARLVHKLTGCRRFVLTLTLSIGQAIVACAAAAAAAAAVVVALNAAVSEEIGNGRDRFASLQASLRRRGSAQIALVAAARLE